MKKIFVVMAVVFSLAFALPAKANIIDESRILLFVGVGSEERPVKGSLLLQDDCGQVLSPRDGVVEIEQGKKLLGQVLIEGADSSQTYDVQWTNLALVGKDNMGTTHFDPSLGWQFSYQPINGTSPLNIVLVNKRGKSDYIRVIFKITYDSDPVKSYGQLWVKVIPARGRQSAGYSDSGENWKKVVANFATQAQFNQQVAEKLDNLDTRIKNIESWCQSASSRSDMSPSSKISYRIKVICTDGSPYYGRYVLCLMDGVGVTEHTLTSSEVKMKDATVGNYKLRIKNTNGCSDWIPYTPYDECTVEVRVSN